MGLTYLTNVEIAQHVLGGPQPTAGVTGQTLVAECFAAAAALGEAAQGKTTMLGNRDPEAGATVLPARQQWVSVTRTALAVLGHSGTTPDKDAALRGPVDEHAASATARALEPAAPQPSGPATPTA